MGALFSTNITKVPFKDSVVGDDSLLTRVWQTFFTQLKDILDPLGAENYATLENNQATLVDVSGLCFDSQKISQVSLDYLIQRVTSDTELVESGIAHLVFSPISNTWNIYFNNFNSMPSSGVTLSVTGSGQVQYTSTYITGASSISRITYRARILSAKSQTYSKVGL